MSRPVYIGTMWDEMAKARLNRSLLKAPIRNERGQFLQVTATWYEPNRSVEQNRLYQQYARIVAKVTGNSVHAVKRTWQAMFLGFTFDCDVESSEYVIGPAHSSHLSVADFGEFLIQIECWAVDFLDGLELPAPGDQVAWAVYEQFLKTA